jgi:hypothetical protein
MVRANWFRLYALIVAAVLCTGCDLAGGIFKAGFTVGLLVVVIALVLVLFLVMKLRR